VQALFPYQEEGARLLSKSKALYLGDDPGLGKSAQIASACDYAGAHRILVVCPASLKINWAREIAKFSLADLPVQIPGSQDKLNTGPGVTIINYDLIIRKEIHQQIRNNYYDVLAIDESHALKEPTSKRTRAILGEYGIADNAERVWLASGTPVPNHPGELFAVLSRLHPMATRRMNYDQFLNYYCYTKATEYGLKVLSNRSNIYQLKQDIASFMLRRKRADVLPDLPDLRIGSLVIENDKALASIRKYVGEHPEIEAYLDGEEATEAAMDWVDNAALSTIRKICGSAKAYALADEITEELNSGLHQIVLMCWHKDTIDILRQKLDKFGVAVVDGRVSMKKRQEAVDRFNDSQYTSNCRVFIGQILAAGVGHTMTGCQDMIIVEPSWVPGENVQAMLRISRIGQLKKCLVRFAKLAGSIDEAIMGSAERKAAMIAELM